MAYTQGLCSALQANINEVAGMNAPAMARQKVGMIDALMSDVNRMGFTADIVPTNGKFRAVQINWIDQACDGDVNTSCAADCINDVTPAPSQTLITEFNCAKYKMGFDENDMRKLCEADSVWVAQNIMRAMNAINVSVDKAVLAIANTNVGETASGGASLSIPLYTSTGAPNPLAWAQVRAEMDAQGASGSPLIVGGGNMDIYARAMQIACCNTNFGVDLSRASGDGYFYNDTFAPTILGAGNSLALAPGAMQMITWNKYLGDYAKRNDSFEHGTIVDPFTGLVYDLKTSYDDCQEKWFVELALNWNIFQVPAAYCVNPDVNLTFLINDCSDGPVVCP
jgi:hypothetical protein